MSLFTRMPLCQDVLSEALTSQERKNREIRRNVVMVIQRAIEDASNRVRTDDGKHTLGDAVAGQRSAATTTSGNIVCRAVLDGVSDSETKRLVSMIKRITRSAGLDVEVEVRGTRLRVIADRATLVARGGESSMTAKQRAIIAGDLKIDEQHDVSTPITSQGSTKGALPKSNAQKRKDELEAEQKGKPAPGDEEEGDEDEDEDIFESRWAPKTQDSRLNSETIAVRIEGAVRRVPRAKLLWKRKEDSGTFSERWMYLAQSIDDIVTIKRKILAETDIPVNKTSSPSGEQGFVMEQYGDLVFITISGIKN